VPRGDSAEIRKTILGEVDTGRFAPEVALDAEAVTVGCEGTLPTFSHAEIL
jgi:hypothetical protein